MSPRRRPRAARLLPALSAAVVLVLLTTSKVPRAAVDADEQARRDRVVARAGSRTVTVGQLENLLAVIPRHQLRESFGTDADTIRRKALDEIALVDILYADGAEERNLTRDPDVSRHMLQVQAEATERALERSLGPSANIPASDIRAYYDSHKDRFDQPLRIAVWRILCATADEARAVLAEAQKDGEPKHFHQLARDHSVDKATSERGGDLGILEPDGTSSEAGLKVDPALYLAAQKVKDGQFVAEPVPEAGRFAVVWRRGSTPERHRTFEESTAQIREELGKERVKDAITKLETELRAAHVRDENDTLVDGLEIADNTADILGKRRPGQVAPITQIGQRPSGTKLVPPATPPPPAPPRR